MRLFSWLAGAFRPAPDMEAALRERIELAVKTVDARMRLLHGYEKRLAEEVAAAYDYCERLGLAVPGPFTISRPAFASDPLVHALFGSADEVATLLASSQPLREYLAGHPANRLDESVFALLSLRLRLHKGFGSRLAGEILRHDEPQTSLDFSDHQLSEPAPDLDTLHQRLAERFFAGLLTELSQEIEAQRQELFELREHLALGKAMQRTTATACPPERCADLQTRIAALEQALMPDALLMRLKALLATPETRLRLEPARFRLDRLGIVVAAQDRETPADTLRFVELVSADRRRWVVMCVRFSRHEAQEAQATFETMRRQMVI